MPRAPKIEEWMHEAVEVMARTGCGLGQAAGEVGQELTNQEIVVIAKRASFQDLLWEARHRYFNNLSRDPNFNQDTVVGRLIRNAQMLEEEGEFDKAAEVWLKLSKIKGWVGPESQVSVFGELSDRDLQAIRDSVNGQGKASTGRAGEVAEGASGSSNREVN